MGKKRIFRSSRKKKRSIKQGPGGKNGGEKLFLGGRMRSLPVGGGFSKMAPETEELRGL